MFRPAKKHIYKKDDLNPDVDDDPDDYNVD